MTGQGIHFFSLSWKDQLLEGLDLCAALTISTHIFTPSHGMTCTDLHLTCILNSSCPGSFIRSADSPDMATVPQRLNYLGIDDGTRYTTWLLLWCLTIVIQDPNSYPTSYFPCTYHSSPLRRALVVLTKVS